MSNEYAVMRPLDEIYPYENNPRNNDDSVGKVAESIKTFGFLQPIVCDTDGVILAGHTRYRAAQMLGLTEVPVKYATNLTPAQARAYRLADNKVSEGSLWVDDMLNAELEILQTEDPGFVPTDFGFEPIQKHSGRKQWTHIEKLCNLERQIQAYPKCEFYLTTFFKTGKEGKPISEIKKNPEMVQPFADVLVDYLSMILGESFAGGDWCICTTPRRRHGNGFHFSTEICRLASEMLGIPFYEDAIIAKNRCRIDTSFSLEKNPKEHNIILYDDIVTTGVTMRDSRALLLNQGHLVFPVVAIKN